MRGILVVHSFLLFDEYDIATHDLDMRLLSESRDEYFVFRMLEQKRKKGNAKGEVRIEQVYPDSIYKVTRSNKTVTENKEIKWTRTVSSNKAMRSCIYSVQVTLTHVHV